MSGTDPIKGEEVEAKNYPLSLSSGVCLLRFLLKTVDFHLKTQNLDRV